MKDPDDVAKMNRRLWDDRVRQGDGNTQPHLALDVRAFRDFAAGRTLRPPRPYCDSPCDCIVMRDAAGKDVLCLASGGGQQSAVFGLLGARVTVLDMTPGQLEADRQAAEFYGYEITTVEGDMRDLSAFASESFDLVYQPISICFVPDVREVYREVARVLRPGGLYRVDHVNPATYPTAFDGSENGWDGIGYRISAPYMGGPILRRPDGSEDMAEGEITGEFRHLLCDIYNGLIDAGLTIRGVWEDPRHLRPAADAEPGSEAHWLTIVAEYFTILSKK